MAIIDSWWDNKVLPSVIGGIVTGLILYYALPGAVTHVMQAQGTPTASRVFPMNEETPTYFPCIACERGVTPIW